LTLDLRGLDGSAACSTGSLRPVSRTLFCVSFVHRTHRAGSAPRVRPLAALRGGFSASADFCAPFVGLSTVAAVQPGVSDLSG